MKCLESQGRRLVLTHGAHPPLFVVSHSQTRRLRETTLFTIAPALTVINVVDNHVSFNDMVQDLEEHISTIVTATTA